jgi:hypothetical protein
VLSVSGICTAKRLPSGARSKSCPRCDSGSFRSRLFYTGAKPRDRILRARARPTAVDQRAGPREIELSSPGPRIAGHPVDHRHRHARYFQRLPVHGHGKESAAVQIDQRADWLLVDGNPRREDRRHPPRQAGHGRTASFTPPRTSIVPPVSHPPSRRSARLPEERQGFGARESIRSVAGSLEV